MLAEGNHKKNFNLLVSTVEDEGSFLFYFTMQDKRFAKHNPEDVTLEEVKDFTKEFIQKDFEFVGKKFSHDEMLEKIYFNGQNPHFDNPDQFRKQAGIAMGDNFLTCPTLNFAKSLFRSSPDTIKVYQWYYTVKTGNPTPICSHWGGTCHSDDLSPLFGLPIWLPEKYTTRERDVSREVISFFSSFSRTGYVTNHMNVI